MHRRADCLHYGTVFLEGMDHTELSERASRCWELAAHVTDEQTRAGLRDLAEKYEAMAREAAAPGQGGGDLP